MREAAGRAAAVGAGGAVGAGARWAWLAVLPDPAFPWPVLVVNVVGSALLGAVLAAARGGRGARARRVLHDAAGVGFCGGFTTFSTFALDVAALSRDGRAGVAAAYLACSLVACVLAAVAGATALGRVAAFDRRERGWTA